MRIKHRVVPVGTRARGDERRAEILHAARELFLERGYAGTSTDAIVERSGGSKETIYAHFSSKAGLLRAVAELNSSAILAVADASLLDPAQPAAALRRLGIDFLGALLKRENLGIIRLIIAESDRIPQVRDFVVESGPKRFEGAVTAFLERCSTAGTLRVPNADVLATAYIALTAQPALMSLLTMIPLSAKDVEKHVDTMLPLFLQLCEPVPGVPQRGRSVPTTGRRRR